MALSQEARKFREGAGKADKARNAATTHPVGVEEILDLSYGPHGTDNLLNLYRPAGAQGRLPVIVSVHGGGYVYGYKEVYHHYCADLARRGFAVVNFNYRLAPEALFPAPLQDTNRVMEWVTAHSAEYQLDTDRLFLVGDSAGGQLASQYAAIWANPAYAACFDFAVPAVTIRAVGLNCGHYDIAHIVKQGAQGVKSDYFGDIDPTDPRLQVLEAIGANYPPAHITTAYYDFLRACAQPMADWLTGKGVPCTLEQYGSKAQKNIAHVFHVDIRLPEATACNDSQCAFFRRYL